MVGNRCFSASWARSWGLSRAVCVDALHRKNDGDRAGRPAGWLDLGRGGRKDDVDLHTGQLCGCFAHLLDRARPSELDDEVLAFDIAEIAQARPKSLYPVHRSSGGAETQESQARNLGLLLCARN